MIITIDGPAGAGKSTVAKALARCLSISYIDTGAMYRALTLKAIRKKVDLEDELALVGLAQQTDIRLEGTDPSALKVFLDGEDVSEEIRSREVTNATFYIARAPKVREIMVQWQRQIAQNRDVVVEGRDIGTVVFPQAQYKFYLDADFDQRASRRIKELREKGQDVQEEKLKEDLGERDHKDFTRQVGPLRKAEDAVVVDSTNLPVEEVIEKILEHINSTTPEKKNPS